MYKDIIFAWVLVVTFAVPNLAGAQARLPERLAPDQPPAIVLAGRAVDTPFPDDSLARIQWAIDRGVDIVPISVQLTGDGHHIVMYDATLTRTTNVRDVYRSGAPRRDPGDTVARWHLVSDYTLEEIGRLRLLDPQGGDHPVPTLEEALDLIDGRALALLSVQGFDIESLTLQLEQQSTENLLLFNEGDLENLRDISAATGIGVWNSVTQARNPTMALQQLIDRFGSDLMVVDVERDQLTPDFIASADQHEVLLSHRGVAFEDAALRSGNTKPWQDALGGPARIFVTKYPDAVLKLMGR